MCIHTDTDIRTFPKESSIVNWGPRVKLLKSEDLKCTLLILNIFLILWSSSEELRFFQKLHRLMQNNYSISCLLFHFTIFLKWWQYVCQIFPGWSKPLFLYLRHSERTYVQREWVNFVSHWWQRNHWVA